MSRHSVRRGHAATWRSGPACQLSIMSGKDMLRNPLSGLSMSIFFTIILAVYVSMWVAFTVLGTAPTASVSPADDHVSAVLTDAGVIVVDADSTDRNAEIILKEKQTIVVLDAFEKPAWNPIWVGLRDAGIPAAAITVVDQDGDVKLDPLRTFLGVVALTGFASVAFIGTTVPLVGMRERGLLRLFGTTPLPRVTFLLAQVPARLGVILVEIAIVIAIAAWRRYVDGIDLLSLCVTLALGSAMLFAFALIFAARSRNAEATQQSMATLVLMLVFTSGGVLPPEILPSFLQIIMNALPSTWFAVAVNADLTGAAAFLPVPVLWVLMGVCACVGLLVAARLFEWDQSEPTHLRITNRGRKVSA